MKMGEAEFRSSISLTRNAIPKMNRSSTAKNAYKAAFSILEVLNDLASLGAKNAISGVSDGLDGSGWVKKEWIEFTKTGGGMFI